jgi:hypothetical protein
MGAAPTIKGARVTTSCALVAAYVTRYSILGGNFGLSTIMQARVADQTLHSGPVGLAPTSRHSPDSGSGASFGAFRGRVIALDPLVGKTVFIAGLPINLLVKYDVEFAAQNRLAGDELWLSAAMRI